MSEPKTIRVLGNGGDYEDWPNPAYKEPSSFAAPVCSAYSSESGKAVLEEVYQWLNNGPMGSWAMRCILHRKIGDMLGHDRVEYHE